MKLASVYYFVSCVSLKINVLLATKFLYFTSHTYSNVHNNSPYMTYLRLFGDQTANKEPKWPMARDWRQLDFVIKLRLIHSAGLKIVNKEVVPSLFVFSIWLFQGKSKHNKAAKVLSLGKLVSFVFLWVLLFPSTLSRETSRLSRKQNCFPRSHTLSVYCFPLYSLSSRFCVRLCKVDVTPVASIS